MNEKIREIAARVREMRELSEISAARMAQLVDVPHDVYLSYEQGEADIPASILYGIAQQLNVDMALLLTGDAPRMRIYSVTRKGEGVHVERRSQYRYQNLVNNFAGKKAEMFLVTVEPKPVETPPSPNVHPGQEFNYLLEGSLKVFINNREIILEEGDCIFFDSSYPHAMTTLDDRPAKFLAIIM